ncbi:hypothetical protein DEJ49_35150 [Streptomyces venezuelae]|uniref:Uncharacterized protein n=1 Tax=Streptomyces venezuelae TaxID=54571 RepID=A0A5P2CSY1_STRVZ|nr:hypothetical protein [Streptomyces venezuelae]QES45533.1 hypothetical protein DEJ49_35150 [Streptomyces venezuelae]
MRHKGGRDSGQERDVERVLDELYATAPPQFVSRREELAARARTDGRAEDARRIRAARRPTLAAWAANLLLHAQPTESRRFLALGRELREAYRTLDAAEIKELSTQRTSVVSALTRQAATLARDAGHRLSDAALQDVASTLRAVLADEDAADQWATGRLESTLTPPSDFPSASGTTAAPKARAAPAAQRKDELAERRRQKREKRAREAREAAEAADRRLAERRTEQEDADASLRRAQEELQRAQREHDEAEKRSRAAADATAEAERAAREAREESARLLEELE